MKKTPEEIIKEAFTFKYKYKFSDEWLLDIVRITKEECDKEFESYHSDKLAEVAGELPVSIPCGDYFSGIPSFTNTMLTCFNGGVDEMRKLATLIIAKKQQEIEELDAERLKLCGLINVLKTELLKDIEEQENDAIGFYKWTYENRLVFSSKYTPKSLYKKYKEETK